MDRNIASDLLAFLAVARERSFTRAAAKLGISQPTLSEIVHGLDHAVFRNLQLIARQQKGFFFVAISRASWSPISGLCLETSPLAPFFRVCLRR
jgi:hypothetical protein